VVGVGDVVGKRKVAPRRHMLNGLILNTVRQLYDMVLERRHAKTETEYLHETLLRFLMKKQLDIIFLKALQDSLHVYDIS